MAYSKKRIPSRRIKINSRSKKYSTASELLTFNIQTYTDQELEFFEEAWATTVAGTSLDKKMEFVIGAGIMPVFELIDDTDLDEEQKKKKLEEFEPERQELIAFDEKIGFKTKLYDTAVQAKVFGRSVLMFENLEEDKSIGLPKSLKLIYSRDLNKVNLNEETWTVKDVKMMNPSRLAKPEEMIYLVNRPDSPIYHTKEFGFSEMQRIVGPARAYRRITEFDLPEIATSMWAPAFLVILKKLGRSKSDAQTDANTIINQIKAGAITGIEVDALDEIEIKTLDLQPKIGDLVQVMDRYERIMIANSQTPGAILGREEEANRATLIGKMRFFIEGPVKADREWLSPEISKQWYVPNLIKMGHEDILKTIKVKAEFEPIFMEAWDDNVDSVIKLKSVIPLPDERILELLNLEEFKPDLITIQEEKEKQQTQEESTNKKFVEAKRKEKSEQNQFFKDAASYLRKAS